MTTRIPPRISIVLYAENVFIVVCVFFWFNSGGAASIRRRGKVFFFLLFVSFDAREAVYMNSVIIPEENVRIRTSGIHLLARFLYMYGVRRIDAIIKDTAIVMGFTIEMDIISISLRVAIISSFIF